MPASTNIFFVSSYSSAYAFEQNRVINSPIVKAFSIAFLEGLLFLLSLILWILPKQLSATYNIDVQK